MKKILVTDSFFINQAGIKLLEEAGYEVVHLDKAQATEEELIESLQGVSVYILGGVEVVTDRVIASADELEAIIFCGVDYDKMIPAAELARQKGIKIFNAPGANATAVAEFALGVTLVMLRELLAIGRTGDKKNMTTATIEDAKVGMIGMGNIGQLIAQSILPFKPSEVIYCNRSSKNVDYRRVVLDELVESSDIIFLTLPKKAGVVLDKEVIAKLKLGCLIISVSPMNLIDFDALLPRLKSGEVRAAVDWPAPNDEYNKLPLDTWFSVNSHRAFNTAPANKAVAESVIQTAVSLLE